jgi:hypothetical protein
MKYIFVAFSILIFEAAAIAQNNNYINTVYTLERIGSNSGGNQTNSIPTIAGPPPGVKGDVYLNPTFNKSVFQLYDGDKIVEVSSAKLDLKQNEFDIITPQGIRVLKGNLIKSFLFFDSATQFKTTYINVKEWNESSNMALDGFFEVILEGRFGLLKKTELIVKRPDYHPALNVGSKDLRLIKEEKFYYLDSNKVFEMPSKRKIGKMFAGYEKEMETFIFEKDLSTSKQRDLTLIFNHYNKISAKN